MKLPKHNAFAILFVSQLLALPLSLFNLAIEYFHIDLSHHFQPREFRDFTSAGDVFMYWFYYWLGFSILALLVTAYGLHKKKSQ
jgi:hypothetical protein